MPFKWTVLASRVVHETPWLRLIEDKVKIHNGKILTYTYTQAANQSVGIVAVDRNGNILLQKSYRHTIKRTLWEIPAGYMSAGEDPLVAAKRELLEETSLTSKQWINLGSVDLAPGIGDVEIILFAALSVDSSQQAITDEDEPILQNTFVSKEELKDMLAKNKITSGLSLVGLYRYLDKLNKEEL